MITNNIKIANYVSKNGVDRIFIDLEKNGKKERQGHLDTWISSHTFGDITKIKETDPNIHIMTRINPIYNNTKDEIDEAIDRGSSSIMLPMFSSLDEIGEFYELIQDRCIATPLFETKNSIELLPEMLKKISIKELHIGLNDLHLDFGMRFMFEILEKDILERSCSILKEQRIPFGIGGIARSERETQTRNFT